MNPISRLFVGSSFMIVAASLVGCGGSKPVAEPGSPITGTITVSGKPPGTYCSVQFVSVANPSENGSGGVDPTGRYSARVPLGRCKVALILGASGGDKYQGKGGAFPKAGEGAKTGSGPPKMAGSVDVPEKLQNPETSGIEVDVVVGKTLDIDFK